VTREAEAAAADFPAVEVEAAAWAAGRASVSFFYMDIIWTRQRLTADLVRYIWFFENNGFPDYYLLDR
jgi:hypothetical protein